MLSTAIGIVLALLVVGFLVWVIDQLPMIEEPYKRLAKGVILFVALIWVLVWVLGLVSGHPVWEWPKT